MWWGIHKDVYYIFLFKFLLKIFQFTMLGKINPLNMSSYLEAPSLNKVAKPNKMKKFKDSATLCREFQALSYDEVLSFDCLLIFICALEDRVRVKTKDFLFIVWFCKLGQGETKEITTS